MDKISLIVPVYNVKEYLRRCLESIVEQDYPNLEVILVNDGSTDEPESIIQNYLSKYKYIHYVEQKNKGVGAARNRGMSIASGEYISFVDSDDVLYPDYCSYLYNIIGDADIAIAGREQYVDDKYVLSKTASTITETDSVTAIKYMLTGKYSTRPAWGKLFRSDIAQKVSFVEGHVFEELRHSLDTMLLAKRIVFADKDLYSYRIRQGSIVTSNEELQIKDFTLSVEYVYHTLVENGLYQSCREEFKSFLSGGIIRNTELYKQAEVDSQLFVDTSYRMLKMIA